MKKLILSLLIISAMIGGCKKANTTNYCYRCNDIQYGGGGVGTITLDTFISCNGFGGVTLAYQKGDSFIYGTGTSFDSTRCLRYQQ